MMQKQKGFSAPVLALSVWTAALAEEMQTGISPRGMIIHGAVQALLLTCISGVFSACWQRAAMQWIWLFSAGAWFLAELFGTVMQAQNICQQEFRSMALIGLLPLLLWAGWCIPPSGWDAPARVLWWFVLLGGLVCLTGLAGQMDWAHLLTADAVQLARWPRVPLYAEYLLWPLLAGYEEPRSMSWLPWLTFLAQAGLTAGMCLVFGAADYPAQELLRAWSADVFSRMDALLLLIWLTCAIFRIGFLCAAVRTVWQRAVQCGKGAVKLKQKKLRSLSAVLLIGLVPDFSALRDHRKKHGACAVSCSEGTVHHRRAAVSGSGSRRRCIRGFWGCAAAVGAGRHAGKSAGGGAKATAAKGGLPPVRLSADRSRCIGRAACSV